MPRCLKPERDAAFNLRLRANSISSANLKPPPEAHPAEKEGRAEVSAVDRDLDPPHRPAPIQVNYLGFPGTMAMPHMDYLIADKIVIPESERRFYSEKIVYLPDTYLPNDIQRRIGERVFKRAEAGLPEAGFVFASFNNSYKFTPDVFDVWMRLLSAIDGSVLWLSEPSAAGVRNLKREARARGIEPLLFNHVLELIEQAAHEAGFGSVMMTQVVPAYSKMFWKQEAWIKCLDRKWIASPAFRNAKSGNLVVYLTKDLEQKGKRQGLEFKM